MTQTRTGIARRVAVAAAAALTAAGLAAGAGAAQGADDQTPLHELRTANNQGWFYTLNAGEAQRAVSQLGFHPSATFGALHTAAAPGRQAVHRLRDKTRASYMLSISPRETGDARFVDEGILGYIDTAQHPGEQQLLRYSNHGQWRVLSDAPANIENMKRAGYQVDGPLGWARP